MSQPSTSELDITEHPDRWVREHRELLYRVIRHADDRFVRALAISALLHYGDEPTVTEVRRELDRAEEVIG